MTRPEGWEGRLLEEIERHAGLPFIYGVSDCLLMALDCARAIDPELEFTVPAYENQDGAARALLKRGFRDVGEALASEFEEINPVDAHRGDLGIVTGEQLTTAVVFVGPYVVGKDHQGVLHAPRSQVKRAFRVP